ncbi:MAG: hypothetical protein CME62_00445 [Halobacteriovoraceae bacterium]|nr:hypothetical protein [Halobacteriovoraceae bacterium]|tara:strand:- start:866 stop:1753 length:888 start_codon:yes stop_codon:yes gene_type:complete
MLKKFAKLEHFLNQKLERFFQLLLKLFIWLIPKPVQQFFQNIKVKLNTFKQKAFFQVRNAFTWIFQQITHAFVTMREAKNNFGDHKKKLTLKYDHKKEKLVSFLKYTPLHKQIDFLLGWSKPILKKFSKTLKHYSTSQGSIAVLALLMISGGIFGVYQSGQTIYQQEFKAQRAPAAAQQYDYKPDYQMYPRRTSTFYNIKVPLLVENVGDVDSLTIDFSVRTSTRFAKIYLEEYEYKLKDYFFTTVQPVISDFPFQEEGKIILKDKIRREVNNFLKANNVEGEVEEVRILFIVGS